MHHNLIIKDGDTTKVVKEVLVDGVQFVDEKPRAGSTNPVTSDGVKGAIGDTKESLQEQIDEIAEKAGSGYIPKGEADVSTLNALTGQENGWLYTLTDDGTLTDGSIAVVAGDTVAWDDANSVWYKAMNYAPAQYGTDQVKNLPTSITSFRTGDVIPVDGPSGTAKMAKDDLLAVTAQNAINKKLYLGIGSTSGRYKFAKSEFHKTDSYERLINNEYPTVYKGFRFYFDGSADNLTCNLLAYDRDSDTYSSIVSASQIITYEFNKDIDALAILLEKSDSSPITMDDYSEDYITLSNGLPDRITDTKIDGFDDVFFGLVEHSDQVFDASKATLHGYWNASGTITQNADFSSAYFRIQPDTDVYTRYAFTYSAWFDKDFNWISSNINSAVDATLHSPVNAYYMCIGTASSILDRLFVSFKPSNRCTWNTEPKFVAKNIEGFTEYDYYDLPFVRNGKVCCNGGNNNVTAYYAGVVVGESYNVCRVKWVWETRASTNYYGSIALINSSNKCDRISDIVDLSLHLVITSTHFVLDVFGKRFGTQQYQRVLAITFDTPLNTSVEHDAYMVVSGNHVIVNVDGTDYTGTFTPDANITSLADVVGKSVVFEHYCTGGGRGAFKMPQFTYFEIKNGNKKVIKDNFRRESGVLSVTPQGHPYMVYSNVNDIDI